MIYPNEQKRQRARSLRNLQTIAESRLWRELRAKRFDGWKFRRQHPCGPYFLDFLTQMLNLRKINKIFANNYNIKIVLNFLY